MDLLSPGSYWFQNYFLSYLKQQQQQLAITLNKLSDSHGKQAVNECMSLRKEKIHEVSTMIPQISPGGKFKAVV